MGEAINVHCLVASKSKQFAPLISLPGFLKTGFLKSLHVESP